MKRTYEFDDRKGDCHLQSSKTRTTFDQSIQLIRSHLPPIQTQVPHLDLFTTDDRLQQERRYCFSFMSFLDFRYARIDRWVGYEGSRVYQSFDVETMELVKWEVMD